jgi:hypothetical protein
MRNQADFDPQAARRRRFQAAMLSREIHRIALEAGVPASPRAPRHERDQEQPGCERSPADGLARLVP